jgi:hypothetical protein
VVGICLIHRGVTGATISNDRKETVLLSPNSVSVMQS